MPSPAPSLEALTATRQLIALAAEKARIPVYPDTGRPAGWTVLVEAAGLPSSLVRTFPAIWKGDRALSRPVKNTLENFIAGSGAVTPDRAS